MLNRYIRMISVSVLSLVLVACERQPDGVFFDHEPQIRAYVNDVLAGKTKERPGDNGYILPAVLADYGVISVRKVEVGVVITFQSMPTDSTPMLWYSPTGFSPLPEPLEKLKANHLLRIKLLRPDWAFCQED